MSAKSNYSARVRRLIGGAKVKTKLGFCHKATVSTAPHQYAYTPYANGPGNETQWFVTAQGAVSAMCSHELHGRHAAI